jgi:hypothetical protein
MLLSAISAFAGMLIPAVAGWLAWPANILLTYILDVVRLFSGIPGIFQHRSITTYGMVTFYCIVLLAVLGLHKHKRLQQATNTLDVVK